MAEKRIFVADTHRRWPLDQKLAIVEETRTKPVSRVAREHGLSPGLLFRWRRTLGDGVAAPRAVAPEPAFVPLALPAPSEPAASARRSEAGKIEIVLAGGHRVIVGKDVDVGALQRILDVLERR